MKKIDSEEKVFWQWHKPFVAYLRQNEARWERDRKERNRQKVLTAKVLNLLAEKVSDHDSSIREIIKILKGLV